MKVEIAGAAAFAALGLLVGALLRPQPDDFRPQVPEEATGFTGPPDGMALGGADPTGGWGARGPTGALPDYVVGTDSLRPPPGLAAPPPAWETEAEAPGPVSEPAKADPPSSAEPAPVAPADRPPTPPAPVQDGSPARPPAAAPSPSPPERPKEGA